ncbi:MAG TPA: CHAP domain-containing protein [Polyangia bacterium]
MKRLAHASPSFDRAVRPRLIAVVACVLLASGCATYLVPAAHEDFFESPFRTLAREAAPPAAAPTRRQRPALALASREKSPRSPRELPLEKFTAPPTGAGEGDASLQPAGLVEGALREKGVRFGTDGQVASLYAYMRREQAFVSARAARPGDVLFFAISGPTCADHTGVVEAVDDIGRITFREVRGGQVRTSYVHPGDPTARRWSDGRVVNSFLRPRRTDDPPAARYFAGEMLCAVGRVRR